jgi:hypothetical protein
VDLARYREDMFWDVHPNDVNNRIALIGSSSLMLDAERQIFTDPNVAVREVFSFLEYALADLLTDTQFRTTVVSRYEVGPTAQPPLSLLVTIVENASSIISHGADLVMSQNVCK